VDELWKNFYQLIIDYKTKENLVSSSVYETDYELYRNNIVPISIEINDNLAELEELIK